MKLPIHNPVLPSAPKGAHRRGLAAVLFLGLALTSGACGEQELVDGVDRPFRVRGAQFVRGELPGEPPIKPGEDRRPKQPLAAAALTDEGYVQQRASGIFYVGSASGGAVAVAVRFEDFGDGYWLFPTGEPDTQVPGTVLYNFTADFGASLPPGRHRLLAVAIDKDGRAGTQSVSTQCIQSLVPDNGNACLPTALPPAFVISLGWDAPVDLDLKVRTPDGQVISAKTPASGVVSSSGSVDTSDPKSGRLDGDSNRDCVLDGRQRESVVFQNPPAPGVYRIYANLNRACGEPSVSYIASHHTRKRKRGDEYTTVTQYIGAGTLIAEQANADTQLGTFVGEVRIR